MMLTNAWSEAGASTRTSWCGDMTSGDGVRRDTAVRGFGAFVQQNRGLADSPDYNVLRRFLVERCGG